MYKYGQVSNILSNEKKQGIQHCVKYVSIFIYLFFIQSLGCVWLFATSGTAARQAPLPFTVSWSLLKLMPIESVMLSNHLNFFYPLLFLPSIFLSIRVFFSESALRIRWPKYWSSSFSINLYIEYSGLVSFKDWLVWSPCSRRDSQECFPESKFESSNFSALSLLYSFQWIYFSLFILNAWKYFWKG